MSPGRFFSIDSPKAVKAQLYGWLNAINYMAPASTAGVGNLCGDASAGCLALCLGWFSGQASMVKRNRKNGTNAARKSRIAKVKLFMHERAAFMAEMVQGILCAARKAAREALELCIRLNGSADVPWEHIKLSPADRRTVFDVFPATQFVDYTKSVKRMLRFCAGLLPKNYHLTFSRSETNEADCTRVLASGGNIAVVFAGEKPHEYLGRKVIDGDKHDLRHLDEKGGVIVGLSLKGRRAKNDQSGFVVRS